MARQGLKLGSDGYRGILGDEFTWKAVQSLTLATVEAIKRLGFEHGGEVPIGYDTRFLADKFALAVYEILTREGFRPAISHTFCPSPYISFAVREFSAPFGVVLSASHNPFSYLGFKLKGPEGGSALPYLQELVSNLTSEVEVPEDDFKRLFTDWQTPETFELVEAYAGRLASLVDTSLLGENLPLTIDFMHGATSVIFTEVLSRLGVRFQPIRTSVDPLFGGGRPEPVENELKTLIAWVEGGEEGSFGAAFDGDGDRLALVDEEFQVVPSHEIFSIILLHLLERQGRKGRIVKTVSLSRLIDRVAESFGAELVEIPVGFKYATEELLKPGTLCAGEESGGIGFGFYLPERDSLLTLLIILEAMAVSGKSLRELRKELWKVFGRSFFLHEDIALRSSEETSRIKETLIGLREDPAQLGISFETADTIDGVRLKWRGGFVLIRLSGTEPLLRLYVDEMNESKAFEILARARSFLGFCSPS